jgi:hypothetical protein
MYTHSYVFVHLSGKHGFCEFVYFVFKVVTFIVLVIVVVVIQTGCAKGNDYCQFVLKAVEGERRMLSNETFLEPLHNNTTNDTNPNPEIPMVDHALNSHIALVVLFAFAMILSGCAYFGCCWSRAAVFERAKEADGTEGISLSERTDIGLVRTDKDKKKTYKKGKKFQDVDIGIDERREEEDFRQL